MKKFGLIIADDYEFEPYRKKMAACDPVEGTLYGKDEHICTYAGHRIYAVKCGNGKVNAAASAAFMIAEHRVDVMLNIGLSGALSGYHKGDLVAGRSFVECDFDVTALGWSPGEKSQPVWRYEADAALLGRAVVLPGVRVDDFGCGDTFLADPEKAAYYRMTFGVNVYDMESAAIASVCHDAGVPFLCIRQISDNADDASPLTYTETNERQLPDLTETLRRILSDIGD